MYHRWATGRQKSGAPSLRNQAGRQSGGSRAQMVEYFKHMPFSDVLGLNRVSDRLEGRCRVAVLCGDHMDPQGMSS